MELINPVSRLHICVANRWASSAATGAQFPNERDGTMVEINLRPAGARFRRRFRRNRRSLR